MDRRDLVRQITPAGDKHPLPAVVPAPAVHGFAAGREPITLTRVEQVVIELSAYVA